MLARRKVVIIEYDNYNSIINFSRNQHGKFNGKNGLLVKTREVEETWEKAQYEEELNLVIESMRISAIDNKEEFNMRYIIEKLPKYLEKEGKTEYEWEQDLQTVVEEPKGRYKEYNFYIDKNYIAHIEEKSTRYEIKAKLRKKWNLGMENSDFQVYQGEAQYKGKQEGLYLSGKSMLATKENFILNNTYTIIIETKNIDIIGWGFLVSTGVGGAGIGGKSLGIIINGSYAAMSGAGDLYSITADAELYERDKWNISAIKYDGTTFSYFVNNKKIGTSGASSIKNSKLYIGGIANSGSSSAGVNWGYANGYYRNLEIYDEAVSDYDLENYKF